MPPNKISQQCNNVPFIPCLGPTPIPQYHRQEYEPGKHAPCCVHEKGRTMNEQEILDILRAEKPYLTKEFGLMSIGLFGSFTKGTQGPESDIDLLVEIIEPRFDFLAGIQLHLEKKFGKPVDVVRKRPGLSERFLKQVGKTIHYA